MNTVYMFVKIIDMEILKFGDFNICEISITKISQNYIPDKKTKNKTKTNKQQHPQLYSIYVLSQPSEI